MPRDQINAGALVGTRLCSTCGGSSSPITSVNQHAPTHSLNRKLKPNQERLWCANIRTHKIRSNKCFSCAVSPTRRRARPRSPGFYIAAVAVRHGLLRTRSRPHESIFVATHPPHWAILYLVMRSIPLHRKRWGFYSCFQFFTPVGP